MKIRFLFLLQIIAIGSFAQLKPITSGVYHWDELPVKKDNQREGRKILEGTTNEFEFFKIHASTQQKGAVPRPPHEMQTFENTGDGPVTYYVFMFRSKKTMDMERSTKAGGTLLLNYNSLRYKEANNKGGRKYFNRPTAMCENYEMHTTYPKARGSSHAPHQHVDTEIILMIEGETEMMIDGKNYKAGPGDLYIAESGKLHGISNAADKPCNYFHLNGAKLSTLWLIKQFLI